MNNSHFSFNHSIVFGVRLNHFTIHIIGKQLAPGSSGVGGILYLCFSFFVYIEKLLLFKAP